MFPGEWPESKRDYTFIDHRFYHPRPEVHLVTRQTQDTGLVASRRQSRKLKDQHESRSLRHDDVRRTLRAAASRCSSPPCPSPPVALRERGRGWGRPLERPNILFERDGANRSDCGNAHVRLSCQPDWTLYLPLLSRRKIRSS